MVIGFWISLFILIISVIMFAIKCTELYLEFYEKMIFGFLIGISLFFIIFCSYYGEIFN